MPRAELDSAEAKVPGIYRHLIQAEQRHHDKADPRLYLSPGLDPVERAELTTQLAAQPPSGMLADLLAGEPVVIPAWMLRGRTFGTQTERWPWIAKVDWLRVSADDVVIPV
ncbi:hypothetical protein [Mycobacterium paraffinicum]|uniref:Uncharacterized protein n=1 Tax=Mycobacterium paraffinicum TaxID=53378 RepID=A0ABP8F2L9_9MYCO|nr:hypothetical protein [Mycobacterium paraffinicum]MCV7311912.1 hypothetical protein [Mycobacterium paraffinicum]